MTDVLTKREKCHLKTETHGEKGHVTTEGEIRVMQLQAEEGQGLAATTEARKIHGRKDSPPTGSEGAWSS